MVKIHTSSFILIDKKMTLLIWIILKKRSWRTNFVHFQWTIFTAVSTPYPEQKREREIEVHVFLPSLTSLSTVPACDFHQHEGMGNLTCLCSCSALSQPHPYTHGMFFLVLPCRKRLPFPSLGMSVDYSCA